MGIRDSQTQLHLWYSKEDDQTLDCLAKQLTKEEDQTVTKQKLIRIAVKNLIKELEEE